MADTPATEGIGPVRTGDVVGERYRLIRRLGGGHTADVFAATDLELDTEVALKVLAVPKHARERAEAVERLLREARAMSALTSDHTSRVLAVGTLDSGEPYIVMEYLDGVDLEVLARQGEVAIESAVEYVRQACIAIDEAHAVGIVHRDIKPSNLLLARRPDGSELVKVLDFGISKIPLALAGDVGLTSTQAMMGTPLYMSPEQFEDASKVDVRSDVWSLGAVLYRLLVGRPPWEAGSAFALHAKILRDDPTPPERLRAEVPPQLSEVILRCLRRDPDERFASVSALAAALADLTAPAARQLASTVTNAPPPPVERARSSYRRWLGGAGLLGGVVAVGLAIRSGVARSTTPPVAPTSTAAVAPGPLRFSAGNVRRLTFGESCDEFPAFSSDGSSIVYDSASGPHGSILLLDVRAGTAARTLTTITGWDYAARLSPDHQEVAFLRAAGGKTALFVARVDGSTPPRQVAEGNSRPTWSRDGTLWGGDRAHLVRYDASSGQIKETIAAPVGYQAVRVVELPDAELGVVFPMFPGTAGGGIGVFDAKRGFRWLLQGDMGVELATTPDGRHLLAMRTLPTSSNAELVDVPLSGEARSLAQANIALGAGLDLSPDGKSVVWSDCRGVDHAAIETSDGKLEPLRIPGVGEEYDLAPIPKTDRLVVLSSRGGPLQPWLLDLGGALAPTALASLGPNLTALSVSPDGQSLALEVTAGGLRLVTLADGKVRSLTLGPTDASPAFRRTSTDVVFTRVGEDSVPAIWTASLTGELVRQLIPAPARRPAPSPVDDRIAYLEGADAQNLTPSIFDARTSAKTPLSPALKPARYGPLAFSASGKKVAVLRGGREIVEIDARTGAVLRTIPSDDQLTRVAYTGERLMVVRRRWQGQIWLADLSL